MLVTGVGNDTEFGQIAQELSSIEKTTTPLQEKLDRLGKGITILGSSAAAIVFLIQIIQFAMNHTISLDTVSEAFITSIVLIVAAVPEGLPTIVAVSLALNIIKMSRENALVKKMIACETIGCVNIICSDKTGTLTENKMTVQKSTPAAASWIQKTLPFLQKRLRRLLCSRRKRGRRERPTLRLLSLRLRIPRLLWNP